MHTPYIMCSQIRPGPPHFPPAEPQSVARKDGSGGAATVLSHKCCGRSARLKTKSMLFGAHCARIC